jgi:hypothetical protein
VETEDNTNVLDHEDITSSISDPLNISGALKSLEIGREPPQLTHTSEGEQPRKAELRARNSPSVHDFDTFSE